MIIALKYFNPGQFVFCWLNIDIFFPDLSTSSMTMENVLAPCHDKLFIDTVIRNTSIANSQHNIDDSDDESDESSEGESANESGDDVHCESDDGHISSDFDYDDGFVDDQLLPDVRDLNMTCDKDLIEHEHDASEKTHLSCVDMDISIPSDVGLIQLNIPALSTEEFVAIESENTDIRLLPTDYEKRSGLDQQLPLVSDKKFICSISCIVELFSFCMNVDCKMPLVEMKERFVGCVLEIRWKCQGGHCGEWHSSKMVNNLYVNNIQTASSILFTGNNFTKVSLLSKCLSLAMFSPTTFHLYQRKYLAPQINYWWNDMQNQMFSAIGNQPVVLSGDGQMDSPGFCAKNCTYTVMHAELDYILHVEMVDVRQSQMKSAVMEKVGCERSLDFLMKKLAVAEFVTDASSQVIKMLGKNVSILSSVYLYTHCKKYCLTAWGC